MDLPDPFDHLVRETLAEELGPPPSRELWKQIATRITEPPRYRSWRTLLPLLRTPLFHSALMVALLAWVIVQPAYRWMQQERPVYDYDQLVGDLVPPSAQQRPRPVTVPAEELLAPADTPAADSSPIEESTSQRNRTIITLMSAPVPQQAPDGQVKVQAPPASAEPAAVTVAALPTLVPRFPPGTAQ
jgi:hypothetical protein